MHNLYKIANGDESVVFFIFANTKEEAEELAYNEWEDNFDEDDDPWEDMETTLIQNKLGVVYWFNNNETW